MKPHKWMMNIVLWFLSIFWLTNCNWVNQHNYSPYKHIFLEEEAHLDENASSPFCDFSIDYSYLNEEDDSIFQLINRSIQRELLGNNYASLFPEEAVDSFKNSYLRNYRKEVGEIFLRDKSQASSEEEIPTWYNQTFSLITFVEEGRSGYLNVSANTFIDMGNAHPEQWSHWINFDLTNGKLLTLEDILLLSAKEELEELLLNKLIYQQAELNPDKNIVSLEDLQKLGFLQLTPMYIPENFFLGKNSVQFLFNRYDIAPYSSGEIIIEIPYEEMNPYLKQ